MCGLYARRHLAAMSTIQGTTTSPDVRIRSHSSKLVWLPMPQEEALFRPFLGQSPKDRKRVQDLYYSKIVVVGKSVLIHTLQGQYILLDLTDESRLNLMGLSPTDRRNTCTEKE